MSAVAEVISGFRQFDLISPVMDAVEIAGYQTPTPIQAATIPHLLAGRDVVGQAQTGTGKTAAFALPLLSRIALERRQPQVLVLTPTRELAIQVSEAFQRYAVGLRDLRVLPIYGGQPYPPQIKQLRRGMHVVVGTPGRVMDHMRQGTLKLDGVTCLVLDEADEMLRMGFIEDVQWILSQTPAERQMALFSATMPAEIRRIAKEHLRDPEEVTIEARRAAATIRQRSLIVPSRVKAETLARVLEAEPTDGVIVFVKTKIATMELADHLAAQGFSAAALNGDMPQAARERTVDQLRAGQLNILVATDVAARGLDIDRISHVINYDLPRGAEAYVHRIGRTGRAGRSGESILLVAPGERGIVRAIERTTKQPIQPMDVPSAEMINARRIARFKERITEALSKPGTDQLTGLIEQYQQETNVPAAKIAAALATLLDGGRPLLLEDRPQHRVPRDRFDESSSDRKPHRREDRQHDGRPQRSGASRPRRNELDLEMERFRLEVGRRNGVLPGNIVGAIANEAGMDREFIGRIEIFEEFSLVELPEGMPPEIFQLLGHVWVSGRQLRISRADSSRAPRQEGQIDRPGKKAKHKAKRFAGV